MKKYYLFILFLCFFMIACHQVKESDFPVLKGPYMGQKLPGMTAELFAPGIVSTGFDEGGITFTPDHKECYWTVLFSGFEAILTSSFENGRWTEPEVASFAGKYYDGWPSIQPDGKRLFFHSSRPNMDSTNGITAKFSIWYMNRTGNGWSDPMIVGAPVNGSESSTCPSVTVNGTIYFSKKFSDKSEKICRCRFENGEYQELEILPAIINTTNENYHAFVSPDESYLVRPLYGQKDAIGGGWNYYVSFRNQQDQWSNLMNLGVEVNSERCYAIPSISADGKYFFFQACNPVKLTAALDHKYTFREMIEKEIRNPSGYRADIYWIDTKVIEILKPEN